MESREVELEQDIRPYFFRPYRESDVPFILSSWGTSFYDTFNYHRILNDDQFHKYHSKIRKEIFARPTLASIVCVSKSDPDFILGWIAAEKRKDIPQKIIHYVYVKYTFKAQGIARDLLYSIIRPDEKAFYTHRTYASKAITKKHKYSNLYYLPTIM